MSSGCQNLSNQYVSVAGQLKQRASMSPPADEKVQFLGGNQLYELKAHRTKRERETKSESE